MTKQGVKNFTFAIAIMLSVNSMSVSGAVVPDITLSDEQVLEFLESGPDWLPKPYKTPIQQGALLEVENLDKVVPGLSKEQVKFLLGTPAIIDIFHDDRWDYIFYERNETGFTDPKRITIIFKNEKVGEVYNQNKLIKKMGADITSDYENAPVNKSIKEEINQYQEIVIARKKFETWAS